MRSARTALVLALSIGGSHALPSNARSKAAKAKAALVHASKDGTESSVRLRSKSSLKQAAKRNLWQDKYEASIKVDSAKQVDSAKERAAATRRAMKAAPKPAMKAAPVAPLPEVQKAKYIGQGATDAPWKTIADIQGDQVGGRAGQAVAMSDDGNVVAFRMPGYVDPVTNINYGATRVYAKNEQEDWVQRGEDILGTGMHNHWEDQNVALSGDGNVVAYGLPHGHFDGADRAGSLRAFQWNVKDERWQRKGSDKHEGLALESQLPGEAADLYVGWSISLDYTGDTVAFGLPGIWAWHKEIPLSVNVAQDPDELSYAEVLRIKTETEFMGAVRVFHWHYAPSGSVVGGNWAEKGTQLAGLSTVDLADDPAGDIYKHAGKSVQLSSDGNTLAFGVSTEEVTDAESLSAVRIFEWVEFGDLGDCADEPTDEEPNHCWVPKGPPIVGSGTAGTFMSMSKRGDTIAFGGMGMVKVFVYTPYAGKSHASTGAASSKKRVIQLSSKEKPKKREYLNKLRTAESSVFTHTGTWAQRGETLGAYADTHVNASVYSAGGGAFKHYAIALSEDGETVAYAVPYEEEPDTYEGEQDFVSVRILQWTGGTWVPKGEILSRVLNDFSFGGGGVSLDKEGDCIAVGFTQVAHNCHDDTPAASASAVSLHGAQLGRKTPGGHPPKFAKRVELRDLRSAFDCTSGDGPGAVRVFCYEPENQPPSPPASDDAAAAAATTSPASDDAAAASDDAAAAATTSPESSSHASDTFEQPNLAVSVHGDPMFKVNGTGTHFWLQAGVLSPLLTWTSAGGAAMMLAGKTFHSDDALNQWFSQFVVKQNGATVLDVSVKDTAEAARQLSGTMDVTVDGKTVDPTALKPARGSLLFSSAKAAVKATMTKKSDGFSDVLTTDAGGLSMSIFSSRAVKFYSKKGSPTKEAKKYMHLNIKFDQGLPKGANGVFTELAGTKVLSEATRALLMPPRTALSPHRIKKDGSGAFLVK